MRTFFFSIFRWIQPLHIFKPGYLAQLNRRNLQKCDHHHREKKTNKKTCDEFLIIAAISALFVKMELQFKLKFTPLLWTERTFISSFWKDFIQMFVPFGALQLAQAECLCLRSDYVWNDNSFIVWVLDRISAYLILPTLYTLHEFSILQTQLNLHLCLGPLVDLRERI